MRLVFMGTPEFAVPSLRLLTDSGFPPVCVVTGPDRKQGRGRHVGISPVKVAAAELGIEHLLQPESVRDPAFAAEIAALKPDVIAVVAYRILPPSVFTLAAHGAFNLHASLLPRYRGPAPIHHAIINGEAVTGVTTFFLKEKVDTGNILLQKSVPIGPDETTGDLYDRMKVTGAAAVVETVRMIEAGAVRELAQDEREATEAPKVYAEQGCVQWNLPAKTVHNFIRGFSPLPGAWTVHKGARIRLLRSRVTEGLGKPAEVLEAADRLVVACADGAVEITELQKEGRSPHQAAEFLRGYRLKVGDSLSCPTG